MITICPFFLLASAAVLTTLVLATPLDFGKGLVKEIIGLPAGWTNVGIPSPTDKLKLSFALKQSDIDGLLRKLDDIADPKSPNFRQWLTTDQVAAYSAPARQTISTVTTWLTSNGIPASAIHQTMDMLQVEMSVTQAETLLSARYLTYSNPLSSSPAIARTLAYSLPANLHSLIDTVQPTTAFVSRAQAFVAGGTAITFEKPTLTREKRASTTTCNPSTAVPTCVLGKYSVNWFGKNSTAGQVASYGGSNGASHVDADVYRNLTGTTGSNFIDINVDGGSNSGQPNREDNLDTQLQLGVAANNQAYFIDSPSNSDFYLELANYLQKPGAPSSVSLSYISDEQSIPSNYAQRACNLFAQAGARGISMFVGSGDDGVGGISGPSSCNTFQPAFPPVCPYVTAVGATSFKATQPFTVNSNGDLGEQVARYGSNGGSGGGFSNIFTMPSYQQSAVNGYIQNLNDQYAGRYNASGRAYPDVSVLGYNYLSVYSNKSYTIGGTSSSAPVWAALTSLMNDYRASQGKGTLGFLNPALYNNPSQFFDVNSGSNGGCGTDGFPAAVGWDAATGLGTPKFSSLIAVL